LAWKFTSDRPVYLQITDRIIRSIISGVYKPGEQIPSVRQLALEAAVNPNTIQRAFADLEVEGIVVSKGTLGRFVTDDVEIIERCRKSIAEKIVKDFVYNLNSLSITKTQAIEMIEEVYT
jgi:DNA-binding transcriptional regulator YhcF (GntR family)